MYRRRADQGHRVGLSGRGGLSRNGCSTALKALIEAIDPRPEDTIIVLGDVIDWGPDSRGCVQQLIDLSSRCRFVLIRGNHEEMLFGAREGRDDLLF
jgi:serine/threonine protein phosphatase 1